MDRKKEKKTNLLPLLPSAEQEGKFSHDSASASKVVGTNSADFFLCIFLSLWDSSTTVSRIVGTARKKFKIFYKYKRTEFMETLYCETVIWTKNQP